jgi:hypothetical protein
MKRQAKAVQSLHRKRRGFTRVEVVVPTQDVPLIREVAKALSDPAQATHIRALIHGRFAKMGFKELLASAPLEGINLTRVLDFGRDIEL